MNCLLCNAPIKWRPPVKDILSFKRLVPPQLCGTCSQRFTAREAGRGCPYCQRPGFTTTCPECEQWQVRAGFILTVRACFGYNEAMKEFMHAYKFVGDYRLRQAFSAPLTKLVQEQGAQMVVPLPLHQKTQLLRGFNQVEGLLECPFERLLVTKDQEKQEPQSAKTREQRLQTPQPFDLTDQKRVRGKTVVLVDDVFTTGRTMYHAAQLMRAAGCKTICGVTLAN